MQIFRFLFFVLVLLLITSCNQNKTGHQDTGTDVVNNGSTPAKTDSLLEALNKRIAENPEDYNNYLERARYFGEQQKYDFAFDDIARAIATDSTKADIYLFKGDLFFNQKKYTEAYSEYKHCLHFDALNVDCLLKKTVIDIINGNYDMALDQINTALKQNESNAYAYYLKGRMYKTMGDTSLASSSYKTAIEVDPEFYEAYIEVGLLYAPQKNDLAKEYYNSAIDIRPRSIEAWYNKAMYLQETGFRKKERYKEAFSCYDTILKIDPRFVAANFNKGFIWLEYLQNYDSAAYHFSSALSTFPEYYQAYYNRGLCFESLSKRNEAENDYRQALSLNPSYTDAALALDRLLKKK